jgi:putative transposase
MPARLQRFQTTGDVHFLTFSCHGRLPYLADPVTCELFEHSLEAMRKRYVFHVFGYVIMPEHIHLLVSEPARAKLDRAIQALKTSVAKQRPQRPFWLARYYDFNIHTGEKVKEKLHYLHRNPVTCGLVERPEQWRWSSFQHHHTGQRGIIEIESIWTASQRLGLKMLGQESFHASAVTTN